jgi:hypothetical protein
MKPLGYTIFLRWTQLLSSMDEASSDRISQASRHHVHVTVHLVVPINRYSEESIRVS